MKYLVLALVLLTACSAPVRQTVGAPSAQTAAAPEAAPSAQSAAPVPPTSTYVFEGVEVFGSHKVPKEKLLELIGLPAPGTRFDLEKGEFTPYLIESKPRLLAAYNFPFCRYSLVAYPPTHTFRVTVDLVDPGDEWRMRFSPEPQGDIPDPEGLLAAWGDYQKTYWKLSSEGAVPEYSKGSCRAINCYGGFDHSELVPLEQRFIDGVPRNAEALTRVLREDRDSSKRMTALMLLPYLHSREQLVRIILPSVRDSFEGVRNEALRLLGTAQAGQKRVIIPLEPVLEALWYPLVTDRNKAAWALVRIVETEGAAHRQQILDKAGAMLVEMAGMQQKTDAEPARKVLTILAGKDLGEDAAAWRQWVEQTRGAEKARR
ncbi:HEAT repeat domain-containing protein [Hyalangium rubrum]|uniref:HEAT repeat domain-containing protein n=1 Tax=Hyalangium rubrum TaxID=3103134 RepID=A0ABU5HAW2_9BACT|nr:HEAT repeat domain-containing protein [Hyalangium sp. s54d21]MDY7230456.1 HEAT repeat domain-containing protein [Hyalangium sp. s54d21]